MDLAENPVQFATLSFHKRDTIRLLQFPDQLYTSLQPAILASWPPGIEASGPFADSPGSYHFKLKGRPFAWRTSQDSVGGARLVRDLLAFLHHFNWDLVMPLSCAQRLSSKDLLIFRPRPPSAAPSLPMEWLAVAPAKSDRLFIIGDSQPAFETPRAVSEHTPNHVVWLTMTLTRTLQELDVFQSSETKYNWVEYKLKGRPWMKGGEDGVKTRIVILRILELLHHCGWSAHTSVQHRTGNDDRRMLDTMFFMRPKGLAVDSPPMRSPLQPVPGELPPYSTK
ncbi:hypothetical protein QBC47DRAFT_182020 [Echria macrotheca]|uniref:Uncharacterized protein n=1 Tax=Echria macrotheca TaxID=438768 RepID=A0AAJ0BDD4_9PEZI|nr:hypothetical protein QBC47DRAFT_182020 [Echria macrotheca]